MNNGTIMFERATTLLNLIRTKCSNDGWAEFEQYELMKELKVNSLTEVYTTIEKLNNIDKKDKNCIIYKPQNNLETKQIQKSIKIKSNINSIFESDYFKIRKILITALYKDKEFKKINEVDLANELGIERRVIQSAKTIYRDLKQLSDEELEEFKEYVNWNYVC